MSKDTSEDITEIVYTVGPAEARRWRGKPNWHNLAQYVNLMDREPYPGEIGRLDKGNKYHVCVIDPGNSLITKPFLSEPEDEGDIVALPLECGLVITLDREPSEKRAEFRVSTEDTTVASFSVTDAERKTLSVLLARGTTEE